MKQGQIAKMLMTGLFLGLSSVAYAQTMCVFDFSGTAGDSYRLMQDYALASRGWGVTLNLQVYKEEQEAIAAFKSEKCDAISLTDISARQFNRFVGTLNAVGAIPDYKVARSAYHLLNHPKLQSQVVSDGYEVGGAVPMGLVYLFSRDRNYISSLNSLMGHTVGVLETDPLQARLLKRVGAKPVPLSVSGFSTPFREGRVDVLPSPAMAYQPFELETAMGDKGGVARFPLILLSQAVILRQQQFPAYYGLKSRTWMVDQLPRMLKFVEQMEQAIPTKRWVDVPAADQVGYQRLMREMRLNFVKDGTYDSKMLTLLHRLRCQYNTSLFDCDLKE